MDHKFAIGTRFTTYDILIKDLNEYEELNGCKFENVDSRLLYMDDKSLNGTEQYKQQVIKKVKYRSITLECEFGQPVKSNANLKKTTTKKLGCKAFIQLALSKGKLEIKNHNLNHIDICFGRYSKKPVKHEIQENAQFLLEYCASPSKVAKYLTKITGEFYNAKDVHNKYNSENKTVTVEEASDKVSELGSYKSIKNNMGQYVGFTYQTEEMKSNFNRFGDMGVLDSTFNLTNVKWTVFIFLGKDENLKSVPFFVFSIRTESFNMLSKIFEIFKESNDTTNTKYLITDKDLSERKALKMFFPNASLNICRFHVIKTFVNKINRNRKIDKETKAKNIKIIKRIVYLEDQKKYRDLVNLLCPDILAYYKKNWHNIKNEFVPCFKPRNQYYDTHTTNNVESYFRVVKKEIGLHNPIGNLIIKIAEFFENRSYEINERSIKTSKRIPHRSVPSAILNLKNKISQFAFDQILQMEIDSKHVTASDECFKFNLDTCCNFRQKFGLPCIHVFFNQRNISTEEVLLYVDGRWSATLKDYTRKKHNMDNKENTITECEALYEFKKKQSEITNIFNNTSLFTTKTSNSEIDESETLNTVVHNNLVNNSEIVKSKYKRFYPLGKTLISNLASKNISQENGEEILELLDNFLKNNSVVEIMRRLKPNNVITTMNMTKEKALIRNLLNSNIATNENPKGRAKNKKKIIK